MYVALGWFIVACVALGLLIFVTVDNMEDFDDDE